MYINVYRESHYSAVWRVGRKLCRLRKEKSLPCILGPTQQQHKKEFLFFFLKEKEVCFDRTRNFLWAADDDVALPRDAHNSFYRSSIHVYPASPFFFRLVSLTSSSFCCCCCYSNFYLFFSSDAKCGGFGWEETAPKTFFFFHFQFMIGLIILGLNTWNCQWYFFK